MRLSERFNDFDIPDLINNLEKAKHQVQDQPGNAWICPTLSKAIICIMLLEDKIHAQNLDIELLKANDDDRK